MPIKETLRQSAELKQVQRLAPMQVRLVRMLEMSPDELNDEINRALDEMPALSLDDNDTDIAGLESTSHEKNSGYSPQGVSDPIVASIGNDDPTLYEVLMSQLAQIDIAPDIRDIAKAVIGNIDNNGYLTRAVERIADDLSVEHGDDIEPAKVAEALTIVRSFDPAGVGASNLREALLLQLDRLSPDPVNQIARRIVDKYFDLLSLKHYDQLTKRLGVTEKTLKEALDIITSLNPKPGAIIGGSQLSDNANMIIPELAVEVNGQTVTVSVLSSIPRLTVSQTFADNSAIDRMLSTRNRDEVTAFLKLHRDEAGQFIAALSMRQVTLFKVMSAIAKIQHDFFVTGDIQQLKPMVLRDIATLTGLDPSTISRATSTKYVSTPTGVYPIKFFFNERSPASTDDNDISSVQIADTIKQLIENEDSRRPLTDASLTSLLVEKGLNVARRTVAKYRERLGYPVARLRRDITLPSSVTPTNTTTPDNN